MLPLHDHLPTRSFPGVNYALIAINVTVVVRELASPAATGDGTALESSALVPSRLLASHMFLHTRSWRSGLAARRVSCIGAP